MTLDDLELLCSEEAKSYIEQNIERKHTDVALDKCLRVKGLGYASLVAEQVKYLQRARKKLPSYYDARCIVVGRSYEQSSGEDVAATKILEGDSLLDLTCGLGVDVFTMSKRFVRVVAVERDEVFAAVARENFSRLGVDNVEVVCASAEEYLEGCLARGERFDVIYCDPDRRGADGRKKVVLEDCSPNLVALSGVLAQVADRLVVKCSPLFDVDEAFRLFGVDNTAVEVVSSSDECKEVVLYVGKDIEHRGEVGATAVGLGSVWVQYGVDGVLTAKVAFDIDSYNYLITPDVALQKGRIARRVLSSFCDIWSDNGYGFAVEEPREGENELLGRVFDIESISRYEPKKLKRLLRDMGVDRAEILKREFPYSAEQVAKQLGLKGSGTRKIAVTTVLGEQYVVILR